MTFDQELGDCDEEELIGSWRPVYAPGRRVVSLSVGEWIGYGLLFGVCASCTFGVCVAIWLFTTSVR
jgi:hypothetical protein